MKEEKPPKGYSVLSIILLIVAVSVFLSLFFYYTNQNNQAYIISYTEFREHVNQGHVSKVVFNGQQIDGTFDPPQVSETASESPKTTQPSAYYSYSSRSDSAPVNENSCGRDNKNRILSHLFAPHS